MRIVDVVDGPLFKYLEPQWAKHMMRAGGLRIGTLYDFRKQEEFGDQRGDLHEGIRIVQTDGSPALHTAETVPGFLKEALDIPSGVKLLLAEGAVLRNKASVPDMYVYCTCERFDMELLAHFGGACVEIHAVEAFFEAVTEALDTWDELGFRRVRSFRLGRCEYRERTETWPDVTNYHPVFRKPPAYAHQKEVRAVWSTPRKEVCPVNLNVPGIGPFCRRVA